MKKATILSLMSLFIATIIISCTDITNEITVKSTAPNLPETPFNYKNPELPTHLSGEFGNFSSHLFQFSNQNGSGSFFPNVNLSRNIQITDNGATLGRVLFYDPQLSLNNSVSCASCHHQENAFADPRQFSVGFGGKKTPRNSMAILNAGLNHNLFWDSRVSSVFDLVLQPVQNHIEMGMESIDDLEAKLSNVDYYRPLFEKAFGDSYITGERIASALTQFVTAITTGDSKFDRVMEGNFNSLNELESLGMNLFFSTQTQCSGCHSGSNLSAPDFPGGEYGAPEVKGSANIGLDLSFNDQGTGEGRFRIPSLRNIAVTGPYMHDGRFSTLEEVIDHYNEGVNAHPALDDKLKDDRGLPIRMNLNTLEKKALVAFLNTLTDEKLLTEDKFSNPFLK